MSGFIEYGKQVDPPRPELLIELQRDDYWLEITGQRKRQVIFNTWWAKIPDALVQFSGRTAMEAFLRAVEHEVKAQSEHFPT